MTTMTGQWLDRTRRRPLPAEDVIADYWAGLGSAKLSFKYDAGLVTIRDLLRAHGVELRRGKPKRSMPAPRPVAQAPADEPLPDDVVRIDVREAMRRLRDGQSFDEVAEYFDADTDSFSEIMLGPWEREQRRLQREQDWLQQYSERQRRAAREREEKQRRRQERQAEREQAAFERRQRRERLVAEQQRQREAATRKRWAERAVTEREKADEQRRQGDMIVWLYQAGQTVDEIAEGEGLTPNKVHTTLRSRRVGRGRPPAGVQQVRVPRDVLEAALRLPRRTLVLDPEDES